MATEELIEAIVEGDIAEGDEITEADQIAEGEADAAKEEL